MRRHRAEGGRREATGEPRPALSAFRLPPPASSRSGGWTLIELVVTVTVMAVLALGAIPLVKTSVKRQKEQQLRESLRMMREAIKEFRRDTLRSEEHTSELQSRQYLVCRLLLEKKN